MEKRPTKQWRVHFRDYKNQLSAAMTVALLVRLSSKLSPIDVLLEDIANSHSKYL